jgi:hypothetical protein
MIWALILGTGLFLLPESPRYYVKKGKLDKAAHVLTRLRSEPEGSEYIQQELAEIVANHEYEMSIIGGTGYFGSWYNCFTGGFWNPSSNIRRTSTSHLLIDLDFPPFMKFKLSWVQD